MTSPARLLWHWHGGKWRLADWLIGHFPPHRVHVERFAGATRILARRARNGALLDGHPCLLYADLYPNWRRLERRAMADARAWRTESLWLNPAAARSPNRPRSGGPAP